MTEHILITGAARGLGLAMTRQLLERGERVSALVRKRSDQLGELEARYGERLAVQLADVTDEGSVRQAFERVAQQLGHLDVLVNNAVTYLDAGQPSIEKVDFSIFARTFEVNAVAPLRVIQHGLPLIRKGQRKLIVDVSSEAGSIGDCWRKAEFAYCMSKSALNMGSKLLQNYLQPEGIKVLALHPGWFNSSGEGRAPISAEQAAVRVLETILKPQSVDGPMYLDLDGKPLRW
jgi:NAD(P)-dependent dehydrogenase (short-subunit alcohol dehydrogenase family)